MIEPSTQKIIGKWEVVNGTLVADANCQRIHQLISKELRKIVASHDGWSVLYQDPDDSRFWELTYPEGHLHGGGPPALTCLSDQDTYERYTLPSYEGSGKHGV